MTRCKLVVAFGCSLLMGLAGAVRADTSDADLRAELDRVKSRLAELEGKQDANWLNEQRAEEIKGLVRDVINDADTRASLLADGATAGHDGKNFYVGSADGANVLKVWGQIQFRYLFNLENVNVGDQEDEGFDVRRARIGFEGHVTAGRKWDYLLSLELNGFGVGIGALVDAKFGTALTDSLRVDVGLFKLPFTREELTSSKVLTGVERSYFNEFFTGNRAEQVQVTWSSDMFMARGSISDGMNSGVSAIGTDGTEIALSGLTAAKRMAIWDQMNAALFVGGALHFETSDGGNGVGPGNYLSWTVDGSVEVANFGIYAAVAGGHVLDSGAGPNVDQFGFVIEVNYNINDQYVPFIRYDMVDDDIAGNSTAHLLTGGVNYYFKKHTAKITLDVVYFMTGAPQVAGPVVGPHNAGGVAFTDGFSAGDVHGKDNFVFRLQVQLLF